MLIISYVMGATVRIRDKWAEKINVWNKTVREQYQLNSNELEMGVNE